MRHTRQSINLLAITFLVLSALACQTITKAFSPNPSSPSNPPPSNDPSSPNPATSGGDVALSLDWLVTADELNSFSTDIGIVQWQPTQDTPGESRICRSFQGVSWSASPNEGLNCILKVSQGSSFADVIDSMFSDGRLFAGAQPVNSTLNLEGEFAVYAGDYPNGHGVFDLILMKGNLVYWSSVTVGTPVGGTPAGVYQSASEIIDTFLAKIVEINLEKSK